MKKAKWLSLLIICFGGGIVYILPYIQYSFYDPMMEAFGISHLQMGNLMSVLGIASAVAYLLGGVLADRFSVKWLISLSLLVTGLAGLWFASFPSYPQLLVIMAIFAVSTILTYWPAMIKAVKLLGSDEEQGKMFGFREAGFGLFALIFSQIGTWLIYNRSPDINGVRNIMVYYAVIYFIAAALSFMFIPNSSREIKDEKTNKADLRKGISYVAKLPAVWLTGLVVFCAYTISGPGLGKLVPYLTNVMEVDSSLAAGLSSMRLYLLPFLAAPIAGFLVDKIRSSTKFLMGAYAALGISLFAFVLVPAVQSMAVLAVIVGFVASFVIYMMRGTYFVPMTECDIPNEYLGTAAGLVSFIGFLPDAFMFTVFGAMMGEAPGEAEFKAIFWVCLVLAVVGCALTFLLQKLIRAQKAQRKPDAHALF